MFSLISSKIRKVQIQPSAILKHLYLLKFAGSREMMKNSIFACLNPVETFWELGRLPVDEGNLSLIGWRTFPMPIDAGVPKAVAEILARALTSAAQVTFPFSDLESGDLNAWKSIGDDQTRAIKNDNPLERIRNTVSRFFDMPYLPSEIVLLSTRKPETATLLFDDAPFVWSMQGQIVLLSDPEQPLPEISEQDFSSLFEDDWAQNASSLQNIEIKGILRPGVDGDVAGFLSFTDTFENNILTAIENESYSAGFDWALLSESDFAQRLAAK